MIEKVKKELVSVKFLLFCISTILFAKGVLTENGWIMIALSVVGFKEAGKLAVAYRDVKLGSKKK